MRSPFLLFFLMLFTLPTAACPFCDPGASDLFSDIADAQAVVLVSKVDTRKYRVTETLLGAVNQGRVIVAAEPQGKLGKAGQLLLTTAGPPNLPYWSDAPRALTVAELNFARQCLQKRAAASAVQWDFAADHLQHPSSEISAAAYNLLAAAPLGEVQKRARRVGEDKLWNWVQNGKVAPERRALYLLMIYRGLSPNSIAWLNQQLFSDSLSPSSPLLGPLAVAYLQVTGLDGLGKIEKHFYAPNLPASRTNTLNRALTLVGEQDKGNRLKAAIQGLFVKELSHAQRGAFVLAPLALWQDRSAFERAEKLYSQNKNITWVKVAVIRFFRSFSGPEAQAALGRLAQLDRALVERTDDPYRRGDLGID